jgi:hypothetical protein
MKFGVEVMPVQASPNSHILISYDQNSNKMDTQSREVGGGSSAITYDAVREIM